MVIFSVAVISSLIIYDSLHVLTHSLLPTNLSLESIKQHDNSLLWSKITKSSRKISVRSRTLALGKRKVKNKQDLVQSTANEKVATLTHSMNDVIAFHVFNTRVESGVLITGKANTFCTKLRVQYSLNFQYKYI